MTRKNSVSEHHSCAGYELRYSGSLPADYQLGVIFTELVTNQVFLSLDQKSDLINFLSTHCEKLIRKFEYESTKTDGCNYISDRITAVNAGVEVPAPVWEVDYDFSSAFNQNSFLLKHLPSGLVFGADWYSDGDGGEFVFYTTDENIDEDKLRHAIAGLNIFTLAHAMGKKLSSGSKKDRYKFCLSFLRVLKNKDFHTKNDVVANYHVDQTAILNGYRKKVLKEILRL